MRPFVDTSAFIKHYLEEPGSNRVLELMARAETLGLCVLVLPEAISTLRRLVREGRLSTNDYAAMKDAMLYLARPQSTLTILATATNVRYLAETWPHGCW